MMIENIANFKKDENMNNISHAFGKKSESIRKPKKRKSTVKFKKNLVDDLKSRNK